MTEAQVWVVIVLAFVAVMVIAGTVDEWRKK